MVRRVISPDQQFQLGEHNLRSAYAEAWLACRYIADRYSENQLGRFYAELDHGRSVDEASRSALKISEAELITRWRLVPGRRERRQSRRDEWRIDERAPLGRGVAAGGCEEGRHHRVQRDARAPLNQPERRPWRRP